MNALISALRFNVGVWVAVDIHGRQVGAAFDSHAQPATSPVLGLALRIAVAGRGEVLQAEQQTASLLQTPLLFSLPLRRTKGGLNTGCRRQKQGNALRNGTRSALLDEWLKAWWGLCILKMMHQRLLSFWKQNDSSLHTFFNATCGLAWYFPRLPRDIAALCLSDKQENKPQLLANVGMLAASVTKGANVMFTEA